ncbi:MAG: YeeE/YedE thiosulfate transporter family protein [Kiritimatiellia bacterium]
MSAETERQDAKPAACWSPYLAGLGLGLTLLVSYIILGTGLGASGGIARCAAWLEHGVAPGHVEKSAYFGGWFGPGAPSVLAYYLVAMAVGILLGAFISAWGSGRVAAAVERGPTMSRRGRLVFALVGGILVGFASRLARGCTSGQALSGTAMLFTGSVVFLVCLFIGGYGAAWFFRRQWR